MKTILDDLFIAVGAFLLTACLFLGIGFLAGLTYVGFELGSNLI